MSTGDGPPANASGGAQPAFALSDYEQARARNIERNNARLRSLGLISAAEERGSNDTAWGRRDGDDGRSPSPDGERAGEGGGGGGGRPSEKKKRPPPPAEGSRKSRRLRNLPSGGERGAAGDRRGAAAGPDETAAERGRRVRDEREALVEECRAARLRAAAEVARAGAARAGRENPTATYEHCLMRVRSMTEKGLGNRVRAIERASGRHCVVKMAIFKSCLQDENLWELAKLASESLERLKGLLPPPLD